MAIAVVVGSPGGTFANNATSVSRAFGSNVTNGSLISTQGAKYSPSNDAFVAADCTKSAGTATVSTPVLDVGVNNQQGAGPDHAALGLFRAHVTATGSCTMQIAGAAAGSFMLIGSLESTGNYSESIALETTNSNSADPGTANANADSGSVTSAGAALMVAGVQLNTTNSSTITEDGSFTSIYENGSSTDDNGSFIYRIVSSGTTDTANWTVAVDGGGVVSAWAAAIAVYKENSAGGPFTLTQQGTMALAGDLNVSGGLSLRKVFNIAQVGSIAMAGDLSLAGDLSFDQPVAFQLQQVGSIAMQGDLGLSGDLSFRVPWEPTQPIPLELVGELTLTGDLHYEVPATFQIAQVGAIALAGDLGLTGDLSFRKPFVIEQQGTLALGGALDLAGDLTITRDGTFNIAQVGAIALGADLSLTGDLAYEQPVVFAIEQVGAIALQGDLALAGELDYAQPVPFAIEQVSPIALAVDLAVAGALNWRVPFALQAVSSIALSGDLALDGALQMGEPLELVAAAPIAMQGTLGLTGDLRYLVPTVVPDVVGLSRTAAIAAIEAAGLVAVVVEGFSADVPTGDVISQEPAGGTAAYEGDTVTITVSSGSIATDPKLIARRKKPNPNIVFKRPGGGEPERKKKREEPKAEPTKPKASPLLMGLLARGLERPSSTPDAPIVAPAAVVVTPPAPIVSPQPEIVPAAPPSEPEEKPQAPPAAPAAPQPMLELGQAILDEIKALRAEVAQLRASQAAPHAPAEVPLMRDPVNDALHAILPALREPVDLEADPPPAPESAPAAPAPMSREQIERENMRRAAFLARRMLGRGGV